MSDICIGNIHRLMITGFLQMILIKAHDRVAFLQLRICIINLAALAFGNVYNRERDGKHYQQVGKGCGSGIGKNSKKAGKDH